MNAAPEAYRARVAALRAEQSRAAGERRAPIALAKGGSNLFRDRARPARHRLDLSAFDHVLAVDATAGWVEAEGLVSYEALVDVTLAQGAMPAVVPELKGITVGGALAGVGIEATSFRAGLVHDTMLELDVLLSSGEVVTCRPDNAFSDLFFGFANSYGTLGYALRARLRTLPVAPFVRIEHPSFRDPAPFFEALRNACDGDADFVDGVVFDEALQVGAIARFTAAAPFTSDYTARDIYYRSLPARSTDFMRTRDYLWRWDTDWFWCSRNFGAQRPLVRRLLGRRRLNSRTWTALMRLNARWGLTRTLARLRGLHPESVIQDVDIPAEHALEFLAFLRREIRIEPVWVCPLRPPASQELFPLYPLRAAILYFNFGFWDVIETRERLAPGHFNRLVEHEVTRLGGIKSLYSDSTFTRAEFAAAYGDASYQALKRKYDPQGRLPGLYEKCVLRG